MVELATGPLGGDVDGYVQGALDKIISQAPCELHHLDLVIDPSSLGAGGPDIDGEGLCEQAIQGLSTT